MEGNFFSFGNERNDEMQWILKLLLIEYYELNEYWILRAKLISHWIILIELNEYWNYCNIKGNESMKPTSTE